VKGYCLRPWCTHSYARRSALLTPISFPSNTLALRRGWHLPAVRARRGSNRFAAGRGPRRATDRRRCAAGGAGVSLCKVIAQPAFLACLLTMCLQPCETLLSSARLTGTTSKRRCRLLCQRQQATQTQTTLTVSALPWLAESMCCLLADVRLGCVVAHAAASMRTKLSVVLE
jgi:hypothetical protein